MDFYGGGGGGDREMAEKYLGIAKTLLGKRDINGSKLFAERALEEDPLIDGVDQILAVADVLLACQRRVNNKVDWYSVLQLPRPSAPSEGSVFVKRQYRRLTLLLHPDRNQLPGADAAFSFVADAFAVLSDPAKKSLFDAELGMANSPFASSSEAPSGREPFWTACTSCCHVHQYSREFLDLSLRCPSCRRQFVATELPSQPPIVPGTDMYYCTWGFFPMGFPGGPNFFTDCPGAPLDLNSEWKPFFSMFPSQVSVPTAEEHPESPIHPGIGAGHQRAKPAKKGKRVAHKGTVRGTKKGRLLRNEGHEKTNVGVGMVSPDREQWDATDTNVIDVDEEDFRGININEAVKGSTDGLEGDTGGSVTFHIDVDATEEILGNLNNLPFLKDDEIQLRMP